MESGKLKIEWRRERKAVRLRRVGERLAAPEENENSRVVSEAPSHSCAKRYYLAHPKGGALAKYTFPTTPVKIVHFSQSGGGRFVHLCILLFFSVYDIIK